MYYLVMRLIQYDFSYIGASQKYLAHCMLYKISCDLACSIGICIYLYLHEDTLFLEMPMPAPVQLWYIVRMCIRAVGPSKKIYI